MNLSIVDNVDVFEAPGNNVSDHCAREIAQWNKDFAKLEASQRVEAALENFPAMHVLSSSFGAQAAVSLHMFSQIDANIPVVLIDTGYLFSETYQFVDELSTRFGLNLHVYQSVKSPAWQEAKYGERWLQGIEGLDAYNLENKVEPMQRAMNELQAGTWFTGLRRSQAPSRANTPFVQVKNNLIKVAPIVDWSDRQVFQYLQKNNLPYHPLWEKGYVSIGDVHTTRSIYEANDSDEVRFFGLKRECGLHD